MVKPVMVMVDCEPCYAPPCPASHARGPPRPILNGCLPTAVSHRTTTKHCAQRRDVALTSTPAQVWLISVMLTYVGDEPVSRVSRPYLAPTTVTPLYDPPPPLPPATPASAVRGRQASSAPETVRRRSVTQPVTIHPLMQRRSAGGDIRVLGCYGFQAVPTDRRRARRRSRPRGWSPARRSCRCPRPCSDR
jgi:hypothetical protein